MKILLTILVVFSLINCKELKPEEIEAQIDVSRKNAIEFLRDTIPMDSFYSVVRYYGDKKTKKLSSVELIYTGGNLKDCYFYYINELPVKAVFNGKKFYYKLNDEIFFKNEEMLTLDDIAKKRIYKTASNLGKRYREQVIEK